MGWDSVPGRPHRVLLGFITIQKMLALEFQPYASKGQGSKVIIALSWDFPSGPVVKSSPSNTVGAGSIPGWGAKIPAYLVTSKPKQKTEAIL